MPAHPPLHVLIAGGGVAALECLLGLHELAADRIHVTLLSDSRAFAERAVALGEPFGHERAQRFDLSDVAAEMGATFVHGWAEAVDVDGHTVTTREGALLPYDVLVMATGAAAGLPWGRAELLDVGPTTKVETLRDELVRDGARRIVVAIPAAPHWPLPGYELALLLARDQPPANLELTLVTAEARPLHLFGQAASSTVVRALEEANVRLILAAQPEITASRPNVVTVHPSEEVLIADRVLAVPALVGHRVEGLAADASGFLRVDARGRVHGAQDVFAAGDCTDFALKQGGLAAQEADAVVLEIAGRAGVPVADEPREVVLRARLMTGSADLWLKRDLLAPDDPGEVATHALWWPPAKLAGRWLAPYLQARRDAEEGVPHPVARERIVRPTSQGTPSHGIDLLGARRPAP